MKKSINSINNSFRRRFVFGGNLQLPQMRADGWISEKIVGIIPQIKQTQMAISAIFATKAAANTKLIYLQRHFPNPLQARRQTPHLCCLRI